MGRPPGYALNDQADMNLMTRLTRDAVLPGAFTWLCRQRRDWPDHADVWDPRRYISDGAVVARHPG